MKTMYLPAYRHNGFVATHALGYVMYRCAQVHELPQSHCGDNGKGTCFHDYTHTDTHTHRYTDIYVHMCVCVYIYIFLVHEYCRGKFH